jgi:dipeptidyl aminopeptidase/acylaminoacyl peptidase
MTRTLTPEDVLRWHYAGALALSPDGSRLAFCEMWSDADKNENKMAIFLVPTDGSRPARQITFGPKRDWAPSWSPDGRHLAFLSIRETDWRSDLYVMDMEAGGDAQLRVTLPRGIAEYAWSGDGSQFALTGRPAYPDDPNRPTEDEDERRKRYGQRVVYVDRMHYRADGNRLVDDEYPAVWVAPADGGEPREIVASEYPVQSPRWTPDGRVAFLSPREPEHELTWNTQLWAVGPDGGEPQRLSASEGAVSGYAITDDRRVVCDVYPVPGFPIGCYDDQLHVDGERVCSELGRNIGKHVLADTIDPLTRWATPTAHGNDIWFHASHQGEVAVYRLGSPEPVLGGKRVVGEFAVAGEVIAFASTAPDDPASIRVAKTDGTGERVVHEPNPWLRDAKLREWRELWVEAEGVRSQAWVMLPTDPPQEPPPAVLNIHGGPHGAYGWAFNMLIQVQTPSDAAIIFGNPPGSLTYGEDFTQLIHKAWGDADFPAAMAFCDEAVKRGFADPERLGVAGGSYGGFLTTWIVGHTDRFKAAVAQRPPTNLTSIFGSSEFGWALMHSCMGAHPWEDRALFERCSPITYAPNVTTPLRLIACTEDYRVPMEQVEQFYVTLKVLGRPVDMVVFRDSHHLVYSGPPWNRVRHAEAVHDWLAKYLA